MRVLQLHSKASLTTGSVVQMMQLAEGLARRGHEVTIAAPPNDRLATRAAVAGVVFEPLPMRSDLDLRSLFRLRRILRAQPFDVVHVHKGRAHTMALAARYSGCRFALIVNRGVSFPLTVWNRGKYRARHVGQVITVCEQNRQEVISSGKVDPRKVTVIYAGVDLVAFDPRTVEAGNVRHELGVPPDALVVTQVGARDWKGWRELIAAFADLAARLPQARLWIVACKDATQIAEVEGVAESAGIADRVAAIGFRYDMPAVLLDSDIVADASWAGTGITGTLREAMAMQRPVVATRCGGNAELVVDGETGILVPPRDVRALAAALVDLAASRERRQAFGEAGRRRVEAEFSAEMRIEKIESLYRGLL